MSSFVDRVLYNWRMAKRGGVFAVSSLLAVIAAGLFAVAARPAGHLSMLKLAPAWDFAGFLALLAVAALLWWRFSILQDEMFHRTQNYGFGWGGFLTAILLSGWGIANWVALAPPINPIAPALIFMAAYSVFRTQALRKWL